MGLKNIPDEMWPPIGEAKEMAQVFENAGRYEEAIVKYKEAITLLPAPAEQWEQVRYLWLSLGEVNLKMKNYEEALEFYKKVMRLPPSGVFYMGNYHVYMAEAYYGLNDMEKARYELLYAYLDNGKRTINYYATTKSLAKKYLKLIEPEITDPTLLAGYSRDNYQIP